MEEAEESPPLERFGNEVQPVQKLIPTNTVRSRNYIWSSFKAFCRNRKYILDQSTPVERISEILADWGLNMRKANGAEYKESVVKTMWNTTAKMIQEMFYDKYKIKFDPFRDIEFKKARDSRDFKRCQLRHYLKKRKVCSTMLTETEKRKVYSFWDENTPSGLQRKFFHIGKAELGWTGKEAVNCLTHYFRQEFDHSGVFTGRVEYNPAFAGTSEECNSDSRWLVSNNSNPNICPVRLLLKLLNKRTAYGNIKTDRLFLTPNPNWNNSDTSAWYKNSPVGRNQITLWIKEAMNRN